MNLNIETFTYVDKFKDTLRDVITSVPTTKNADPIIDAFVNQKLLQIVALAQTVMADGRLDFTELARVVRFTSELVRDSLQVYDKSNKTHLLIVVREIIQFLVEQLYRGPGWVKTFVLNDGNLDGFINIIYALLVKGR